jgi:phosphatidylserine/phosphatidylglycerophosphate/cardiolipin synthase-like enzyme
MYTTVGSFNMDVLSSTRNLEVSMHVLDPRLADAAKNQIQEFILLSKEIKEADLSSRSLFQKALHWAAYWVARFPQVYVRSPAIRV